MRYYVLDVASGTVSVDNVSDNWWHKLSTVIVEIVRRVSKILSG